MSDGSRDVRLDREEWCAFMVCYGLGGNCGSESCVELTDAHINVKAIKRAICISSDVDYIHMSMVEITERISFVLSLS